MNRINTETLRHGARQAVAALAVTLATVPAFAAAIDVDDVVTDIGAQLVPIAAIGAAVLLVVVAIKAFKWVKRAL